MRRTLGSIATSFAVLLALVACELAPPEPEAEGMLPADGSYIDDSGLVIAALKGSLEGEVGVSVKNVDAPEVALPTSVRAVGEFLEVSAVRDLFGMENPFVLAYPVPSAVNTESLALAILLEPEDLSDADESTPPTWELLPGVYDAEGGYFVTTVALLAASGRTVVLVEAPGWSSPQLSAEPQLRAQQDDEGEFLVSCTGFDDDTNNLSIVCAEGDEDDLELVLEAAYADYRGIGFASPYLMRRIDETASSFSPNNYNIVFAEYLAQLRPARDVEEGEDRWPCGSWPSGATNLGGYSSGSQSFFVCIDSGGVTSRAEETARHEYFHATQYGYPAVRASNQKWVKESTATASERSLATMARDPSRRLRVVDEPLTGSEPSLIEYTTQDFFVYIGARLGRGLDYLIDVFEEGASTGDVDAALPALGLSGGIEALYWAWAKNQAFEAQVDLGAGELGTTCALNWDTATPVEIDYSYIAAPAARTVNLPPLTSSVVLIRLAALPDAAYSTRVTVAEHNVGDPDDVRVKFYDPADIATTNCWNAPESNSFNATVNAGQTVYLYALISNLQQTSSAGASIAFEANDLAIEILSPDNNASFTEGDDIEFLTVATGLGGQNPDATQITWTYPRYDGVPIVFNSANGDTVTRRFCDGTYTVEATAVDAITSQTVSDSVTFTVSNASPPPPECAPSIDIVAPSNGDTFAFGESVTFEAVIDDDQPGIDEPLYPIIWREGGPSGLIISRDHLTFSREKFAVGTHEIYVEYGTASDTVSIEVVATTNTKPTANISSPADRRQFSHTELGYESPTITLYGVGNDLEDGALSGSALTWEYLREGSSQWVETGTGSPATLSVVYGTPDNITTYRVRLRATDSEGLFDVDEIEILILNPPG